MVIPDAIRHGQRGLLDYNNEAIVQDYFWSTIIQNVNEFKQLHTLAAEYLKKMENVLLIGSSMGGFSASGIFVENKEIAALVNIGGICLGKSRGSVQKT
jgi:uncharacterized protein